MADTGRGLAPGGQPGIGVPSMRERVEAVGGSLVVESSEAMFDCKRRIGTMKNLRAISV